MGGYRLWVACQLENKPGWVEAIRRNGEEACRNKVACGPVPN